MRRGERLDGRDRFRTRFAGRSQHAYCALEHRHRLGRPLRDQEQRPEAHRRDAHAAPLWPEHRLVKLEDLAQAGFHRGGVAPGTGRLDEVGDGIEIPDAVLADRGGEGRRGLGKERVGPGRVIAREPEDAEVGQRGRDVRMTVAQGLAPEGDGALEQGASPVAVARRQQEPAAFPETQRDLVVLVAPDRPPERLQLLGLRQQLAGRVRFGGKQDLGSQPAGAAEAADPIGVPARDGVQVIEVPAGERGLPVVLAGRRGPVVGDLPREPARPVEVAGLGRAAHQP